MLGPGGFGHVTSGSFAICGLPQDDILIFLMSTANATLMPLKLTHFDLTVVWLVFQLHSFCCSLQAVFCEGTHLAQHCNCILTGLVKVVTIDNESCFEIFDNRAFVPKIS